MKFIVKILIGILAGILIGNFTPEIISRLLVTFEHLFNVLLKFIIPFVVFFFVAGGIAKLKSDSGKILASAVGIAYLSTIFAGFFACIVAVNIIGAFAIPVDAISPTQKVIEPLFSFTIDPITNVISALVCAFIFGVGANSLKTKNIATLFAEGRDIIELSIVKVIVPLLPFYIAAVFANFTSRGVILDILETFGLVLLLAITMHIVWLFVLYTFAAIASKQNVFTLLKNMLPAYLTGIGTMSSVATMPVTLAQTRKNGVSEPITNFSIPLFANIHLSGSTITVTTCAIAVLALTQQGVPLPGMLDLIPFILMLGIIMVAAPGVPGGAVMASLGILASMLGFSEQALGLIIAVYIVQDSFGTACNVTGDGALAVILDRVAGEKRVG